MFRGIANLPTNNGLFHTKRQHRELVAKFTEKETDFNDHINKTKQSIPTHIEQIEIPVPKHNGCNICNLYFSDYKVHINSIEHKLYTNKWTDCFDQIDTLIETMNGQVKERLSR